MTSSTTLLTMKTLLPLLCLLSALLCPSALCQEEESTSNEVKALIVKAEAGDAEAQCNLGVCYANGKGVRKDGEEAVKWYRKAADQGLALRQYHLGLCYANGEGVPEDWVEGYAWLSLAGFNGITHEGLPQTKLSRKMTPEQIAEGQQRLKELLKEIEEKQEKAK